MAHTYADQKITLTAGVDVPYGVLIKAFGVDSQNASLVIPCTTAGESAIGVSSSQSLKGEAVSVTFSGVAKAQFGATLSAGTQFTTSATGLVVAATPGSNVLGTIVLGAQAGEIGSVLFDKNGTLVTTGN